MGNFKTLLKFIHPYEIARDEVKSNEFSEEVDKLDQSSPLFFLSFFFYLTLGLLDRAVLLATLGKWQNRARSISNVSETHNSPSRIAS